MKARAHMGSWWRMIIALFQLRKESLKKIQACTPWPLRYRCSALSQLGAGRCDLSTDMKYYLFMIKKELRCTSKAQFSVITLHQSTVLTIYCAFIYSCKSTGSPVSYSLFVCWMMFTILVMKLECHGTRRHYMIAGAHQSFDGLLMIANLQNNFEEKHFNLKSLVADLFVSLDW